jgi:uncharacterized protein (TIRG00374 family)
MLITVVLLWWTLRDVSPAAVWQEIRRANGWLLGAAVGVATFSFVLRAIRWRILLLPAHAGSSFGNRFGATCIGFMANNILPARLGEFARAFALSRTENLRIGACLASLVVERIFDGLILAFFLFATMLLPGFPIGGESGDFIRHMAAVGAGVFGTGFALLWGAARFPEKTLRLFEHSIGRLLSPHLSDSMIPALASFIAGLGALHRPPLFLRSLVWTIVVWLNLAASIWLGLLAFGIQAPGFTGAVFLQSLIAFAVAVPSSPGFFGLFEAASRIGLELWDVPAVEIVSFATSYHILTFLPVTLIGLWYVRRFGFTWSEVGRGAEAVEEAVSSGEAATS